MTPKQKARYLIEKFNLILLDTALGGSNTRVKQCALICAEQLLYETDWRDVAYWQLVIQEIQNL
jgi:hypothetical protein